MVGDGKNPNQRQNSFDLFRYAEVLLGPKVKAALGVAMEFIKWYHITGADKEPYDEADSANIEQKFQQVYLKEFIPS
jgi:hypothetical protein